MNIVSGQMLHGDGLPFRGGLMRAFHESEAGAIRMGEDTTDADGRYTIRYEALPGVDSINLRVSVADQEGRTLHSSDVIDGAQPLEMVSLTVPDTSRPSEQRRLEGRVVFDNGLPAENLTLRLVRLDFGGIETRLDETTTRELGLYSLPFDLGGEAAGLEIRAVDAAGEAKPLSRPMYDLGDEARIIVNLIAPATLQPLSEQPTRTEFQRLTDDLTPHLGEMKLAEARENAERRDLTVLNQATGWDARLIALAANAEKLREDPDVELPQEAVYGLLRAGLPSDKLQLAQVSPEVMEQALTTAREAGIVSLEDQQVAEIKTQFGTFADQLRLAVPAPGSRSTYRELLDNSGLDNDDAKKFASVYLNHRGDADQLWKNARDAGLDDGQVRTLQLQGKLAFLTGNSTKMTSQLQEERVFSNPAELVEQDFYNAEEWEAEVKRVARVPLHVTIEQLSEDGNEQLSEDERERLEDHKKKLEALIPPAYAGETVGDGLRAYAEDMARKVRLSYPTQVVGCMVEQDDTDEFKLGGGQARSATATLLKNAAAEGFRLGQTPVETFFKANSGILDGIDDIETAQQNVKTLQRVYQITPSNEAMPVLMKLGLTSAYDIVALSQEEFLERYVHAFPSEEQAKLVYRKAQQVSSVTYNVFTIAKKLDSEPQVRGMSAPAEVRESVRNELIKQFPTLESLFGSMDFCECEHCRSVLSPAAYLVDLLQFVDVESEVWSGFLTRWKKTHDDQDYPHKDSDGKPMKPYDVLVERRPDIPNISLTCENTHTALPYIDVVNEILEYYVANEKLTEDAAHDTGEATTAELLAEPQNVIASAYDKLQQARYPLNLPFDLWLETVRSFCDYFETPLWRLLETFRPGNELFAPTQPYDRATIFIESLGLSPGEYAIFTDPNMLNTWYELYGYSSAAEATTEATDADTGQRIDLNSAKALSRRLGVTYKEIVEIVQTGFVNPKHSELVILYKLGVTIRDVLFYKDQRAFYEENRDLLGKRRAELTADQQQRFDALKKEDSEQPGEVEPFEKRLLEVEAFEKRLDDVTLRYAWSGFDAHDWLNHILEPNAFDDILMLADPDAGSNFDLTTLRYANGDSADAIAFLKINLFVRLWRKLGWTIGETDRALQAFVPKSTPYETAHLDKQPLKTALIYLAHFKWLDERMRVGNQSRLQLITLWSDLSITGKDPLYAQLFLTRNALKSGEVFDQVQKEYLPVFDDPLGNYLSPASLTKMARQIKHEVSKWNVRDADKIDSAAFAGEPRISLRYDALQEVQYLSYQGELTNADKERLKGLSDSPELGSLLDAVQSKFKEFMLVKGHLLVLQGALGLTADEIGRILTAAGRDLATEKLSLESVSLLYRYGLLSKALKLSVRDLIALKQLSGLDPLKPLHPDPLNTPDGSGTLDFDYPFTQTLGFVEVAERVKDSGLTVEDLDYLLRHRFDETGKYAPDNDATLALMKTLAEGIRAIRAEHAVPADPAAMGEEVLRQRLGLALAPEVVERFLAMMNGTVEFTATKTGVPSSAKLVPEAFEDEPSIREVSYDEDPHQIQKLTFRGVLFEAEKDRLKEQFPSSVFSDLLDDLEGQATQARLFFDNHLKKQKLRLDGEAGFLDAGDFEALFKPLELIAKDDTVEEIEQKQRRNEETLHGRRARIATSYFPFLQRRLIKQFVVQTMATQTGADATLVEALLTDDQLLGDPQAGDVPQPLLAAFTATGERGLIASFFDSTDDPVTLLEPLTFVDADTALADEKPAGTDSMLFEGYLEVPLPGTYRFYVELDEQDAEVELRFDHLPEPFLVGANDGTEISGHLELKSDKLYRFTLELRKLGGGEARLLVQGETLPKETLAQLTLYPRTAIERADHAQVLLSKALQLIQSLDLNEREVRYLLIHAADFVDLNLSKLATRAAQVADAQVALEVIAREKQHADADLTEEQAMQQARVDNPDLAREADRVTSLFAQFLRLAGYARLKRELAGGTDELIGIFETSAIDQVYDLIARLTRREETNVKATAKALFGDEPSFKNESTLQRLWEALQVVERFGVPVASVTGWTRIVSAAANSDQRFAIARDLKEAIKARFEPDAWQRVAQPIFDRLRQRQRDALVAHIVHQCGFARMEQLYEYFLIDPGMEPVVQTSRIRLAISSLQLFIQRCLINLEQHVSPSVINARQWEWMKRYRVWEANRKIFLFPENWLEPEFRDDKTHLFRELEGNLLQGDVSSDLVEDAFLNYLKRLEELARLDIVAMHLEDNPDPALRTLHVIGRTYSEPHKYFYRRYAHQMWTPWEPVTAEIEGDHLAPVVWRDRLYLFWVTFMEKPEQPAASAPASDEMRASLKGKGIAFAKPATVVSKPEKITEMTLSQVTSGVMASAGKRTIEAQLHWSEYLQGEWSTRESGGVSAPSPIVAHGLPSFDSKAVFIHVSKERTENDEERGVFIHLEGINQAFYLAGRNSIPESRSRQPKPAMRYPSNPEINRYWNAGALKVNFKRRITTEDGGPPVDTEETPSILQQGIRYTLLPCDNDIKLGRVDEEWLDTDNAEEVAEAIDRGLPEIAALMKPVFYQDNAHTLFIEPNVEERTIEDWQEWVTRTPRPEPVPFPPDGWKDPVKPMIPIPRLPIPIDPDDPIWRSPFDRDPRIDVTPGQDWLVNPATRLRFDGEVIGSAGRTGLSVLPSAELAGVIAEGGMQVTVHAGSEIESGSTVVVLASDALDQAGLVQTDVPLNIVGGSGFNSALARNLDSLNLSGAFNTGVRFIER